MPNLRLLADNAADRATVTTSTTSGTLTAANLLNNIKSLVWRATGTTASISASWASDEQVSCVVLPFCNLTSAATMRVRGYSDTAGTVQVLDTGTNAACPAPSVKLRGFTTAQALSAYAYGGGAFARAYFAQTNVRKLVIDLVDAANPQGYVEASRLLAGAYWSPKYNADRGASLIPKDSTKNVRTEAGDLISDRGIRTKSLDINLSMMPAADRSAALEILLANGLSSPIFISLFPESADAKLDRDYQLYGKLSDIAAMTLPFAGAYSTPLRIESI
jgi:hypothetical protein